MQITKEVSSSEFDWFTSCRAIDAMVMFNTPFRGQQELSLIGDEQTTSLLVVMIDGLNPNKFYRGKTLVYEK